MLGLRTEVFAQRIHKNVLGCVPITKELESAEVLETTHEKAKFLGKHWIRINTNLVCHPTSERRAPGLRGWKPLSGRRAAFSNTRIFLTLKPPICLPFGAFCLSLLSDNTIVYVTLK